MDKDDLKKLVERTKAQYGLSSARIPINEIDEDLVILKETSMIATDPIWVTQLDPYEGPLYEDYIKKHPGYKGIYLRASVIKRLVKVSKSLPKNWTLVVRAGHRPVEVQKALFQKVFEKLSVDNPGLNHEQLTNLTRGYVSDVTQKSPPHCTGSAVDVDVMDNRTGKLVDFGSQVNEDSDISHIHSNRISRDQYSNRVTLLESMLKAGFAPLAEEWWHFSYGDQTWAAFYNRPHAIYSIKEPNLV